MSEEKLFEIFLNHVKFDMTEYLLPAEDEGLNDYQKETIEKATEILQENIIGDVQKFGGNFKKNEKKFKEFEKKAEEEMMQDKYKSIKKDLKGFLKTYLKSLRKLIERTCLAYIPVKELPWVDIVFRTTPRLEIKDREAELIEDGIAYYGDIKCKIGRTTIYGKMKDADPLFAPIMGSLDLSGYSLEKKKKKASKSKIFPYVSAVINSLDSTVTRSQLAKYHEGYQRHGDPVCDFLMKDKELMDVMAKLTSGLESKRLDTDIAVCSIAIPHKEDETTMVLVCDESKEEAYETCFESLLRFSAALCEAPSSQKAGEAQAALAPGATPGPQAPQAAQSGGSVRSPGGQELKVWTPEELVEEAQKRGGGIPSNMESWSEEDLENFAKERGSGIPEGMEVWTEEDLEELKKERQGGGLNIPEWKVDEELPECKKCGYTLRKGWSECPVCGTPVGEEPSPEGTKEKSAQKPAEEQTPPEKAETPAPPQEAPPGEDTQKEDAEPTLNAPEKPDNSQ